MNRIARQATTAFVLGCAFSFGALAEYGVATVSDVRVAPLLRTEWGLGDFGGGRAFNLYTPNNYSCGCCATAYSQIMNYWRKPSVTLAKKSYLCWQDGNSANFTTIGGLYDWDLMPSTEAECTDVAQREALGHLVYDFGVAAHMSWYNAKYSYSSTLLSVEALRGYFGYSSARTYMTTIERMGVARNDNYRNAMLASLDAGMPVSIGIRTAANQGHQVVIDGYGFDGSGNLFCHLNFGWKGAANLWYKFVDNTLVAGDGIEEFEFLYIDEIAYNIHPSVNGDVVSGRVLDSQGNPVAGATVRFGLSSSRSGEETVTDANGIYSFRFATKGKYKVSASHSSFGSADRVVDISKDGASVDLDPSINFAVPYSSFSLLRTSDGVVANRWGEDLVLGASSTSGGSEPTTASGLQFAAATTFDGYLLTAAGEMAGTIEVKAGKTGKTGTSRVTASVMVAGQSKKLSFRGVMAADGNATLVCNGQPDLALVFDADTISGGQGTLSVVGVRNLFASKDKAEVSRANARLKTWIGAVNVVWDAGYLTVTVASKGKVKVTGMVDGKKVSSSSRFLLAEAANLIPVIVTKPTGLAILMSLPSDGGDASVSGLASSQVGKPGTLPSDAAFHVDRNADLWGELPGVVLTEQIPDGLPVTQTGTKWTVPKAGKVAYVKGTTEIDKEKAGQNPSALKLSYKAKDGSFKGSFKVYVDTNGKLKATTVNVTGVMAGNVGYGTATIKNLGSVQVRITGGSL